MEKLSTVQTQPHTAIHGDLCRRCIDWRPGNKCDHEKCEHPEIIDPTGLRGLAAREAAAHR